MADRADLEEAPARPLNTTLEAKLVHRAECGAVLRRQRVSALGLRRIRQHRLRADEGHAA